MPSGRRRAAITQQECRRMISAATLRTAGNGQTRGLWPSIRIVALIQFFCALAFGIDIAVELHNDLLDDAPLSGWQIVHLAAETLAVGLLLVGSVLSHRELRALQLLEERQRERLVVLRGQFDDILVKRFEDWGLSRAESDIALLSLRGLKISEIARLRNTKEGTIKAQLSAVFHKAGIGTRTELLGLFMDEFLDFGATQTDTPAPPRRSV
jgi:DNA-binding CsgD family transcriptional regulator